MGAFPTTPIRIKDKRYEWDRGLELRMTNSALYNMYVISRYSVLFVDEIWVSV